MLKLIIKFFNHEVVKIFEFAYLNKKGSTMKDHKKKPGDKTYWFFSDQNNKITFMENVVISLRPFL